MLMTVLKYKKYVSSSTIICAKGHLHLPNNWNEVTVFSSVYLYNNIVYFKILL